MENRQVPALSQIWIYPIKSLDGVMVDSAEILPAGALWGDRAFALVDRDGRWVNGKRDARIHRVRSRYAPDLSTITLWIEGDTAEHTFSLHPPAPDLGQWFSDYFQQAIALQYNPDGGFPDDTNAPGPTLISRATLETVAQWFHLSLAETRRRFRTNLEIDGVPPFWEDHLFSETGNPVPFQIGQVMLLGINPCQRCIVPTRNSYGGEATPDFQKQFAELRRENLPEGVARSRFNHFYRLAVNTQIPSAFAGYCLTVHDPVILNIE